MVISTNSSIIIANDHLPRVLSPLFAIYTAVSIIPAAITIKGVLQSVII